MFGSDHFLSSVFSTHYFCRLLFIILLILGCHLYACLAVGLYEQSWFVFGWHSFDEELLFYVGMFLFQRFSSCAVGQPLLSIWKEKSEIHFYWSYNEIIKNNELPTRHYSMPCEFIMCPLHWVVGGQKWLVIWATIYRINQTIISISIHLKWILLTNCVRLSKYISELVKEADTKFHNFRS